jgi:hypothetical protein
MGKIKQVEFEMDIVIEAMKLWPEKRDEYLKALSRLNGVKGRLIRSRRTKIAKSYSERGRS